MIHVFHTHVAYLIAETVGVCALGHAARKRATSAAATRRWRHAADAAGAASMSIKGVRGRCGRRCVATVLES